MSVFPVTLARVPHFTKRSINERLRHDAEERVAAAARGGPDAITARLAELRSEWDIDRAAQLHGGAVAFAGGALTLAHKRFAAISLAVGASLLLGALFGWSPQIAILRRLGFRTMGEIERERRQLISASEARGVTHAQSGLPPADDADLDDPFNDVTDVDDLEALDDVEILDDSQIIR